MNSQRHIIPDHLYRIVYTAFLLIPFCLFLVCLFLAGCSSESSESSNHQTGSAKDSKSTKESSITVKESGSIADKKNVQSVTKSKEDHKAEKSESPELKNDEARELFEKLFTERIDGNASEDFDQISEKFMKLGSQKIISQLIIEMQSEQQIRREIASTFLSQLALDAKGAEEVLLKALEDESQFVRINSASTLSVLNSHIKETVSALIKLLSGDDKQVHMIAIIAFRNVADQAESAIPILIQLLQESDTEIKKEILNTLQVMKKLDSENLKTIQQLVDSDSEEQTIRDIAKKVIDKHANLIEQ